MYRDYGPGIFMLFKKNELPAGETQILIINYFLCLG